MFRVKRIYEPAADDDGYRVLVDALWPRGMTKAEAGLAEWLRAIAPSTELRREFHGTPGRFSEFQDRYAAELDGKPDLVERLRGLAETGTVTLLFAARDTVQNNAVALKAYLERSSG